MHNVHISQLLGSNKWAHLFTQDLIKQLLEITRTLSECAAFMNDSSAVEMPDSGLFLVSEDYMDDDMFFQVINLGTALGPNENLHSNHSKSLGDWWSWQRKDPLSFTTVGAFGERDCLWWLMVQWFHCFTKAWFHWY